MDVLAHSRIAVADPERFGGDPRARWMRPGDGLREDWNEVEYVRADQLAGAVEARGRMTTTLAKVLRLTYDERMPDELADAIRSLVASGGQ